MECSDPECRESLISMINGKVSKAILISVTLGVMSTVGYFTVQGLAADAREKEKRQTNTKDIAVVQEKIENIEKTVKRIEDKIMTSRDIVKAVKEAMGQ